MMTKLIQDARSLAYAIKEIANIDLTPRPYNRFDPANTIWWLVPSIEWPAYKYGKLFFDSKSERIPLKKDGIFCGFDIEKGLGQSLEKFYHNSLIMDNDWLWSEFIKTLTDKDSITHSIISKVLASSDELIITISITNIPIEKAQFFELPDIFLAQKESFEASQIFFQILNNKMQLKLIEKRINFRNQEIAEYANKFVKISSLSEIGLQLLDFVHSEWTWIDLCFGTIVQKNIDDTVVIKLWRDCLDPWKPWLRCKNNKI